MIAQMAATAGSVAVGSTIGHGISSMLFGGGGSSEPTAAQQTHQQTNTQTMSCEVQAKSIMSTCQISIRHLTHPVFLERPHRVC